MNSRQTECIIQLLRERKVRATVGYDPIGDTFWFSHTSDGNTFTCDSYDQALGCIENNTPKPVTVNVGQELRHCGNERVFAATQNMIHGMDANAKHHFTRDDKMYVIPASPCTKWAWVFIGDLTTIDGRPVAGVREVPDA